MKKIFPILLSFLLFNSCVAQQFEDAEFQEPIYLTVTGVLSMSSEGTASVVQNNEYQRVFHFDAKKDMVEGWEYILRLRVVEGQLKERDLIRAALVAYGISPKQAKHNAVEFCKIK